MVRCVCVLGLDHFGDYAGDSTVRPAAEAASQLLGVLVAVLGPTYARTAGLFQCILHLRRVDNRHWQIRHSAVLAARYLLRATIALQPPPQPPALMTNEVRVAGGSTLSTSTRMSASTAGAEAAEACRRMAMTVVEEAVVSDDDEDVVELSVLLYLDLLASFRGHLLAPLLPASTAINATASTVGNTTATATTTTTSHSSPSSPPVARRRTSRGASTVAAAAPASPLPSPQSTPLHRGRVVELYSRLWTRILSAATTTLSVANAAYLVTMLRAVRETYAALITTTGTPASPPASLDVFALQTSRSPPATTPAAAAATATSADGACARSGVGNNTRGVSASTGTSTSTSTGTSSDTTDSAVVDAGRCSSLPLVTPSKFRTLLGLEADGSSEYNSSTTTSIASAVLELACRITVDVALGSSSSSTATGSATTSLPSGATLSSLPRPPPPPPSPQAPSPSTLRAAAQHALGLLDTVFGLIVGYDEAAVATTTPTTTSTEAGAATATATTSAGPSGPDALKQRPQPPLRDTYNNNNNNAPSEHVRRHCRRLWRATVAALCARGGALGGYLVSNWTDSLQTMPRVRAFVAANLARSVGGSDPARKRVVIGPLVDGADALAYFVSRLALGDWELHVSRSSSSSSDSTDDVSGTAEDSVPQVVSQWLGLLHGTGSTSPQSSAASYSVLSFDQDLARHAFARTLMRELARGGNQHQQQQRSLRATSTTTTATTTTAAAAYASASTSSPSASAAAANAASSSSPPCQLAAELWAVAYAFLTHGDVATTSESGGDSDGASRSSCRSSSSNNNNSSSAAADDTPVPRDLVQLYASRVRLDFVKLLHYLGRGAGLAATAATYNIIAATDSERRGVVDVGVKPAAITYKALTDTLQTLRLVLIPSLKTPPEEESFGGGDDGDDGGGDGGGGGLGGGREAGASKGASAVTSAIAARGQVVKQWLTLLCRADRLELASEQKHGFQKWDADDSDSDSDGSMAVWSSDDPGGGNSDGADSAGGDEDEDEDGNDGNGDGNAGGSDDRDKHAAGLREAQLSSDTTEWFTKRLTAAVASARHVEYLAHTRATLLTAVEVRRIDSGMRGSHTCLPCCVVQCIDCAVGCTAVSTLSAPLPMSCRAV